MDRQESLSTVEADQHNRSRATALFAILLAIASLTLWFGLGFPWQHHNESLVWAISLEKASLFQVLTSNQIPSVQNFRPLGVALAWVTFHMTSGGVWLQQLVNFTLTIGAWALACTSCKQRMTFAWLSLICGAAYFSGYIYLFHLHGVFYPPLFLFIAVLLVHQSRAPSLKWQNALALSAVALVASLFHPYASLIFAAYLSGLWLECWINRRTASLGAAVVVVAAALALAAALVLSAPGLAKDDPVRGLLTSYQMLEVNHIVSVISGLLAVVAGASLGRTPWMRVGGGAVAALGALALMLAGLPVIFCFIVACLTNAVRHRRMALTALIVACGVMPIATGSGSPTYGLFVLMPCITAISDDVPLPGSPLFQRRLAGVAIVACLALLVALRAGVTLPLADKFIQPLRAEQEKTAQLMSALAWLDQHGDLTGRLELCTPAEAPTASNTALDRNYRAPAGTWTLDVYDKARYGSRLTSGQPLELCFGGQSLPGAQVLYSLPGRWAGTASIQRPVRGTATP